MIDSSLVSAEDGSVCSPTFRLIHGQAIRRLDLIIALAHTFDVPAECFVTHELNP